MLLKHHCSQHSLNPLVLIHACHVLITVGGGRKREYYEKSSCIIVHLHRYTHYISSLFNLVLLLHHFHYCYFQLSLRIISCYLGRILLISFPEYLLMLWSYFPFMPVPFFICMWQTLSLLTNPQQQNPFQSIKDNISLWSSAVSQLEERLLPAYIFFSLISCDLSRNCLSVHFLSWF